eukprot:1311135-Prymnesium_polylepis.1
MTEASEFILDCAPSLGGCLLLVVSCDWGLSYGLWCFVRRYSSATRLCGASGTSEVHVRVVGRSTAVALCCPRR